MVRNARNEEWAELGRSLQEDFQKNQKRFWSRVHVCNERRADVAGRICDDSGQVIVDDKGIRNRWKTYFSDLVTYCNKHFQLENIYGAECHPVLNTSSFCCRSLCIL